MSDYQEHADYLMGSASEQQNAYAVSQMNRKPDDKTKITELIEMGRFVVVNWCLEYYPYTDATLPGRNEHIVAHFGTRQEAEIYMNTSKETCHPHQDWDFGYDILPHQQKQPTVPDNDVPF